MIRFALGGCFITTIIFLLLAYIYSPWFLIGSTISFGTYYGIIILAENKNVRWWKQ